MTHHQPDHAAGGAPGGAGNEGEPAVAALEEVWSSIVDLGSGLAPGDWDLPTDCPGWTVRDQMSHMIGTERTLLGEAPPARSGPRPAHVRNEIGEANEAWVEARRALPGVAVLDEFRQVTARRLEQLRSFGRARFDELGPSPVGQVPYREFMDVRAFDCWVHEQDIRRAVGRPGDRYGAGESRAIDRVAGLLGYMVARRAGAPEGTVVQWRLTGPLGRDLNVAVRDGRGAMVAVTSSQPDVRFTLDSDWLVRLGCGRSSGADALAAGGVVVEGDAELGRRVLDGMMGVMI